MQEQWEEQIADWRNRIEELQREIRGMEKKRNDCEDAVACVLKEQMKYEEDCEIQKRKALALYESFPRVYFARVYGECVKQHFAGTNCCFVHQQFAQLQDQLRTQVRRTEESIEEYYAQIRDLEFRIMDAERQRDMEKMPWS